VFSCLAPNGFRSINLGEEDEVSICASIDEGPGEKRGGGGLRSSPSIKKGREAFSARKKRRKEKLISGKHSWAYINERKSTGKKKVTDGILVKGKGKRK